MDIADLRVALFSGNYNYVRDGANQALNRLVDYLLRQGAAVRVYAPGGRSRPRSRRPATWSASPRCRSRSRSEYRFPLGLSRARTARTSRDSRPTCSTSPRPTRPRTPRCRWAEERGLPVLASVHTRFETYPRYYGLAFIEPWFERHHAALLPPLRRAGRAVRKHGRSAARAGHERRHRHLVARGRPRRSSIPAAATSPGAARSASATTRSRSASSAGW